VVLGADAALVALALLRALLTVLRVIALLVRVVPNARRQPLRLVRVAL
jgi:hypothetical protein